MKRVIAAALSLLLCASATARLSAQSAQSDLGAVASAAASAWRSHSFGDFVGQGRVQVTLPGVALSTPVAGGQAQALLQSYVRGTVEVGVSVASSSMVGEEGAYVELSRRFRKGGSQEIRTESILLAYRRIRPSTPPEGGLTPPAAGGWVLTEIRAVGGG